MPLSSNSTASTVSQFMHAGVIDCTPQTPLRHVAALMAQQNVHCVVVNGLAHGRGHTEQLVWGIISDVDLMRAASAGRLDDEAGHLAATEIITIGADEDIEHAAQLMGEHDCSHLIVTTGLSSRPVGVISSIDVARALAR